MLRLHTNNRLEGLAQSLAETIRPPLHSPLQPELVVVQSQGMARWLRLQLAQAHGICSNCEFPFPRAFSYAAFRAILTDLPADPAYSPDLLVWRIMKHLPGLLDQAGFEELKNYLFGKTDGRKLFQLSERLGYLFDQYLIFRPDLVMEWQTGDANDWQARLWREISTDFQGQHPAALHSKFIEQLKGASGPIAGLPVRVAIFGISALPPYYLSIFTALDPHVEVNLFLLEPCREFWGYISSEREQERTLRRAGKGAAQASEIHLEKGNRLLASMGQLGRDFRILIQEIGDWQEPDGDSLADPGEETLLTCIQSDVLNLRDRGRAEVQKKALKTEDNSVEINSCHSPLRELEVLHDHLLDWFQKDPDLAPRDILVMIPDIELYAPFVHAVFGSPEQDQLRIPFSLADRTSRTQSHLIETFLSILNLAGSRLGVSRVLAILESEPVRNKFELAESDLELIRHWVEEVRIRWGLDLDQRAALGLPAWSENTWRHGLERLLLGYALAGNGEKLFKGILPYDDIEGGAADVLGRLAEFIERLFSTLKSLESPRSLDQWAETFQSVLRDLVETGDDDASELNVLRDCFENLSRAHALSGFDRPVNLAVVLEQLNRELAEDHFGAGYLTGGVTFCALKPMRSIPAKVICLLGMNDRAFPRAGAQLSFDLMAEKPQLGDRSSRQDDRYLFLETLISARERLYISYVGQSIRDNGEAPPSVLVSELMDYIVQGFESFGQDIIKDHILTRHRLQAFSKAYFIGDRLFSYSLENLRASQAIQPERAAPGPFISVPLAEPEPEWRRLTLQSLSDFIGHPARFLATKRLGIRLPSAGEALEEREPFGIEGLERYQLQQELLEMSLGGLNLQTSRDLVRASGRLPAGSAGDAHYARLGREIQTFGKTVKEYKPGGFEPPILFKIPVGSFLISGHCNRITPNGLLFYRPATIKPGDLLRAWVEHLLWHSLPQNGKSGATVVLGTESVCKISPVAQPLAILEQLLQLYWKGLCQPLKFFPKTSFAFAEPDYKFRNGTSGKTKKPPISFAEEAWYGSDFKPGAESEDDYFSLLFRGENPLDAEFEETARMVFDPLLAHSEETEL